MLNRGWKCFQLKASGRFSWKKYLVIACIACESWAYRMVHGKLPLLNFKLDLEHENVDILKNGFYHRILQPSEYPKRERAKKNFFFETLLDGPLFHWSLQRKRRNFWELIWPETFIFNNIHPYYQLLAMVHCKWIIG